MDNLRAEGVLLLAIGAAVTEIAVRGRRQHETSARRAGYLDGLSTAVRAVATSESVDGGEVRNPAI